MMDIFNRPPTIAKDALQYTIYPAPGFSDEPSTTALATCIHSLVDSLLPNFIWHRDSFELKVVQNPDDNGYTLSGRMRVGDCVDDEWYGALHHRYSASDLIDSRSVFDSDGEFLLIEAAEALPVWVKPSNSENRVWIHNYRLHLVPISHVSPPSRKRIRRKLPNTGESDDEGEHDAIIDQDEEDWIAANDALKLVRDPLVDTFAPSAVESILWRRISSYPDAAKGHIHLTKAYVPIDIARALSSQPSLVQKAVETFYTRDAIQLRAAHKMLRFPPDTSVLTSVKMTRTAYAQLQGQKFYPPKVFGRWQELEGTKEWKWKDTGMKIAVGFEMLFQESKNKKIAPNTGSMQSPEATKELLRRNAEYLTYIQRLASVGYFGGEIEGSEVWKERETKAAYTFLETRRDDTERDSFAHQVGNAIANSSFAPGEPLPEEDSDDWLNVDPQAFDAMLDVTAKLSQRPLSSSAIDMDQTRGASTLEDHITAEQTERLQKLASQVNEFVEGEGDLEGALFADEALSDFSDEPMTESDNEEEMEIEADQAARQAAMDNLVPGLEPSEYGKMPPSFHGNSQRVTPTTLATDIVEELSKDDSAAERTFKGKSIRQPILPRDRFDGVDSDDETDEEDSEEEEDKPQVVGDVEIDMSGEQQEFLEFSRQALGISDSQWKEIIHDRKERGGDPCFAFVGIASLNTLLAFVPPGADSKLDMQGLKIPETPHPSESSRKTRKSDSQPNPDLNSFEAVMKALDDELSRLKAGSATGKTQGKGKARTIEREEESDYPIPEDELDIVSAMEAELKAALAKDGEDDDDEDELTEAPDLNLIKNFLESFKSQAGLSGPVGNLVGRLQPGWTIPRDES
ncbi:hypothetical protein AX16_005589 [Volvariella volvacea WC 439]|nr:hypothetical protein AX16_005589 [Volvariella volvacea WC 439]